MGTVIVLIILALIVGLIIYKMYKDKKAGKHSCSCGGECANCASSGICHNNKKE